MFSHSLVAAQSVRPASAATMSVSLSRRFGLLQATALNMSNMIGIGPFITIPILMSALGGPQALLGWLVAVLVTIPDGMVWSELGAAMPGSGGTYGISARASAASASAAWSRSCSSGSSS